MLGKPLRAEAEYGIDNNPDADFIYALVSPPAWHADALCKEYAHRLSWFPTRGESLTEQKAICGRCLVREECAAAGAHESFGIWGGHPERQRRQMRRPHATTARALRLQRGQLVRELAAFGTPIRAIADIGGISPRTVRSLLTQPAAGDP